MSNIEFLPGPKVSSVSREDAEAGLIIAAKKRNATAYALEQMEGHWVAALVREAELPFGGPADSSEEAPGPKSEGPDDTAPDPDSGGDSDGPPSDGPLDGPPEGGDDEKKDDKHKGGDEDHIVHQIWDAIQAIGDALGVPVNLGDSPVPGMDDQGGPPGGPGGPMGGPPGPPAGPPGMGGPPGGDKETVRHERALKPGETPPGSVPVGAPSFSSVRADHPWAHLAGKTASFRASIPLGENDSIVDATKHVASLAHEIGYNHQVREGVDENGNRIAVALVTAHPID
jgi:hypothetical protein